MFPAVFLPFAAFVIWRVGKSVFAPLPPGGPLPGVGMRHSGPLYPVPVLPTLAAHVIARPMPCSVPVPAPAAVAVPALPPLEPLVRFAAAPARLAKGSTPPPLRAASFVAPPPLPKAPPPPRRRQGLYHVSRPAHGLDEVPRRRK